VIKKAFLSVIAFIVFLQMFSDPIPVFSEEIETTAASYILIEAETRRVLENSESEKRVPAGALNKLMTALIAVEYMSDGGFSMDTKLTASNNAHTAGGAVIWLDSGEEITVRELFKGLLLGNANDAAIVFAEKISGSCEDFTWLMNEKAADLGMNNTFFTSPYLTDDENQYTTAYDAAILAAETASHSELHDIMKTWLDNIRDGKTEVVNENSLVKSYNGIIGVKAWHTEKSGYCLAACAEREGNRYVSVVMGCSDKDERFSVGKKLLNTGFANYKIVIPGFSSEYMKPLKVKGGVDRAVLTKAESIPPLVIPKGSEGNMSTVVLEPLYIKAPVKKGQNVGTVAFYLDKTLLYETRLITTDSVEKNSFRKSFIRIIVKMFK